MSKSTNIRAKWHLIDNLDSATVMEARSKRKQTDAENKDLPNCEKQGKTSKIPIPRKGKQNLSKLIDKKSLNKTKIEKSKKLSKRQIQREDNNNNAVPIAHSTIATAMFKIMQFQKSYQLFKLEV